ncbi:putative cyclase-domain-containing protein [Hyaloraphidium curvatum]|nr:putative cyclase-domain-containing protein [Hyaloraphidium curvatum]
MSLTPPKPAPPYPSVKVEPLGDNAEAAISEAAKKYSNWEKFGREDRKGTVNFITDAKRVEAAKCVKTGKSISCALHFNQNGPQTGLHGRVNPQHHFFFTNRETTPILPHGIGFSDDGISMALQCSTQWDGLGHCFDHGVAYQGVPADKAVTSMGDHSTGIEKISEDVCTRGVLLDVGRAFGQEFQGVPGVLPDGFAIKPEHILETIKRQGPTSEVRKGDIVLFRTGQMDCRLKHGWGSYAGGDAPGLSFETLGWIHEKEIAGLATDTWGFEVRPNEFPSSFQPCHQVAIPHMGLLIGEIWNLQALAEDCAKDGVYEFMLVAPPLPVTGAVGSPLNPLAIK